MRAAVIIVAAVLLCCACRDRSPSSPIAAWAHDESAHEPSHGGDAHAAVPILHVKSLRASQAYFRDQLGFKLLWDYGEPPDFGAVGRGDAVFFLCQQCQSAPGTWSFVFVENVDKLHDELKSRGARILSPPEKKPWNLREMQVADLDGNVFRFAGESEHD